MRQKANTTQVQKSVNFEERRKLLKLGAAGMPMALTVRASAAEAVISQLRCCATLLDSMGILVDEDGAAWVNLGEPDYSLSSSRRIRNFKRHADWEFPSGTVPSSYRPSGCTNSGDDSGDDSCSFDDQYNLYSYYVGDEICPADNISNGSFTYSGNEGLYILLSEEYADAYGANGSWQGISCIVSAINYLQFN